MLPFVCLASTMPHGHSQLEGGSNTGDGNGVGTSSLQWPPQGSSTTWISSERKQQFPCGSADHPWSPWGRQKEAPWHVLTTLKEVQQEGRERKMPLGKEPGCATAEGAMGSSRNNWQLCLGWRSCRSLCGNLELWGLRKTTTFSN